MIDVLIVGISIFILTFFLVFGILSKLNIFGSRIINLVISVSIALYSFLSIRYVEKLSSLISYFLISVVFIFFLVLMIFSFSNSRKVYKEKRE